MYQKEKSSNPNVANVEELAYKQSISFSTLYGQGDLKTNMRWQIHRQAYCGEGRGTLTLIPSECLQVTRLALMSLAHFKPQNQNGNQKGDSNSFPS